MSFLEEESEVFLESTVDGGTYHQAVLHGGTGEIGDREYLGSLLTPLVARGILSSHSQLLLDLGLQELLLLDQHVLRFTELLYRLRCGGRHLLLPAKYFTKETHFR